MDRQPFNKSLIAAAITVAIASPMNVYAAEQNVTTTGAATIKVYETNDLYRQAQLYKKAEVDAFVSTNASSITSNATDISTNTSSITSNATDISTNTSSVASNADGIASNATDISTNTSSIASNATGISTNTSNITVNSTNISTNTSTIDTIFDGTADLNVNTITTASFAQIGGDLDVAGAATLTGTLAVFDTTTTNGIDNTGDVATDTLTTTGDASIGGNAAIAGSLGVTGLTTTNGIANTGDVATDTLTTTGDATFGGNAAIAGTLGVMGMTTTNGIANTGAVMTDTLTTTGAAVVGNGLTVNAGGANITGATSVTDGNANLNVSNGAASLTVTNAGGTQNGIVITETETRLRGGTGTTEVVLDDSGATIQQADGSAADLTVTGNANIQGDATISGRLKLNSNVPTNFGANRLQNIGDGRDPGDAVTVRQLRYGMDDVRDEARRGIAIANSLDVFMPDPDKNFRVNLGGGYYNSESAIGLTGAGRINQDVAVYFGIGTDTGGHETAGKLGVSYQW